MSRSSISVFQYLDADRFLADRAQARESTPLRPLEERFFCALQELKKTSSPLRRKKIWAELERIHQTAVQEWDYVETMALLGVKMSRSTQAPAEFLTHDAAGRLKRAR